MSELAALNPHEDTVEGMTKKRATSYAFNTLKDDELKNPVRSDWRIKV